MKSKKLIKSLLSAALLTLSMATVTNEIDVNAATDTTSYEYVKVTEAPTDWSGEYLIVYEAGKVAFDGSLTTLDANNNTKSITISDDKIAYTTDIDKIDFTIASVDATNYSIKASNGKYIGNTEDENALNSSDTALNNTISLNKGDVSIESSSGSYLKFNNALGQKRFRYYKSGQQAIQLYKKTEVSGDSGSTGGSDSGSETPTTQWTVTLNTNGGSAISPLTVNDGAKIDETLLTTTKSGYTLEGWYKEEALTNKWNFATDTVTSNLTLYANWTTSTNSTWELVTDIKDLTNDSKIVIAAKDYNYALSTTQNGNNRGQAAITKSTVDGKSVIATPGSDVQIITLGIDSGKYTLFTNAENGYLYAASSNKNYLRSQTTLDDNGKWNITIASNGNATLTAQGTNTRNTLKYNDTNSIFSCYSSGQKDICLYKENTGETSTVTSHKISFVSNGGTNVAEMTVNFGDKIDVSKVNSTRDGYTLDGWYTESTFKTEWDFNTNTVTGDLTLYAKWLNNSCTNSVKDIEAYANLAYKYTKSTQTVNAGFKKVTSIAEVQDGSKVIVVSVDANNSRQALTTTNYENQGKALEATNVTATDNYLTSYENATVWTVSGNHNDGFKFASNDSYLNVSDNNINTNSTGKYFHVVANDNNAYITLDYTKAIMLNETYFKNYSLTNISKSNYATALELYVEYANNDTASNYFNADFRLQLGVNKEQMDSLSLPEGATFGIEISTADKTEKVNQATLEAKNDGTCYYIIVGLGDVLNNINRATTTFTVKVIVEFEGHTYYSNITKEFSIVSMVQTYYNASTTKDKVTNLYNYFNENGFYNQEA